MKLFLYLVALLTGVVGAQSAEASPAAAETSYARVLGSVQALQQAGQQERAKALAIRPKWNMRANLVAMFHAFSLPVAPGYSRADRLRE